MARAKTQNVALRLITIPASHYCEKARWALNLCNLKFSEEGYWPMFHYLGTKPNGGRSAPLMIAKSATGESVYLTDSSDILKWCNERQLQAAQDSNSSQDIINLFPNKEAERLEKYYSNNLGPHTRRALYFFLFQKDEMAKRGLSPSPIIGTTQRFMGNTLFPVVRNFLLKGLNITEKSKDRSLERVDKVFAEVSEILEAKSPAAGQKRVYLASDQFSAADLSFTSMAALLLVPENYPYLDDAVRDYLLSPSSPSSEVIQRLRATTAGKFALDCYKEFRPPFTALSESEQAC